MWMFSMMFSSTRDVEPQQYVMRDVIIIVIFIKIRDILLGASSAMKLFLSEVLANCDIYYRHNFKRVCN